MHTCEFCDKKYESKNAHSQHRIRCSSNPDRITAGVFKASPIMPCQFCGVMYKGSYRLNKHEKYCASNPITRSYKRLNGLSKPRKGKRTNMHCVWCGSEYKSSHSVGTHETFCTLNPNKRVIDEEIRAILSANAKKHNASVWTTKKRKSHSDRMKLAVKEHPDSYSANNVSGRTRLYEYKGMTFKGKWELDVAKAFVDEGLVFTNKIDGIEYFWDETQSVHTYFPDFYLTEFDLYVEVKGYARDRDLCKWKSVKNLIVIKENEINLIRKGQSIRSIINLLNR